MELETAIDNCSGEMSSVCSWASWLYDKEASPIIKIGTPNHPCLNTERQKFLIRIYDVQPEPLSKTGFLPRLSNFIANQFFSKERFFFLRIKHKMFPFQYEHFP